MRSRSPRRALAGAALLVGAFLGCPSPAHASVLVFRNLTGDLMSVCYMVGGMSAACFGSADVPPYGTVTVNKGATCVERWKVTRARDGLVKTLVRSKGSGCGDRELIIRREASSFSLDAP